MKFLCLKSSIRANTFLIIGAKDTTTCSEVKWNTNTHGMQQISSRWGFKVPSVQACMAECENTDKCIQWTYRTDPSDPLYQQCFLKSSKGTESTEKGVVSGSCVVNGKIRIFYSSKSFHISTNSTYS
jgi:hypothetical protein